MAHLLRTSRPTKGEYTSASPHPHPALTPPSTAAASQQTRHQADALVLVPPLPSAALLGVSLLNAARADHVHGPAFTMAREARPGKLRPISTLAKARTQHKSVRHGDQYSILPSPVKPDSISHVLVSSQVQSNPFEHNISGFANTSGIPSVPPSCTVHGDATSDGKHNLPGSEAAERPGRLIATSPSNTVRRRSSRTSKRQLLGDGLTRNAGRSSRTETINAARRQPRGQRSAGRKNRLEEHISEDREIDTEILGASNEAGQTSTMTKSTNILSSAEDDLQRSDEANAQHEMHKTAELDHAHSKELAFEFNHVPKRPGRCQTDIGKALVRGCSNARVLARDPEISYESLVQTIEDLCKQLKLTIADVQSSERGLFKGDAYMYIFGALYLFVESIHQRLGCMPESSTWPVTATHVLQRLTGEILSLEDHIASWRVNLRQQHKGDPFIQHARSNIIKPLRQMNASLRRRIDQLEISALNEDYLTKLRHSRKRKEENDIDRARDAAYKVERWKWWQNLHISRMECEPCIERRKGLSIMTLGELEEKDANGHPIERVPIFKLRPTITPQWLSAIGQTQEWTRDAELALLGGLEKFAGPRVFENIFRDHCGRGGMLRDYKVVDVVAKALSLSAMLTRLHQEKGWALPEWIHRMPRIP